MEPMSDLDDATPAVSYEPPLEPTECQDYAAIVLYYRLGATVEKTIDALMAQTYPPVEIIVVDNASNDGVVERLLADRQNCPSLQLRRNRGYAGGMNAGANALKTSTPLLLFLTHEVILEPDCMENLLNAVRVQKHTLVGPVLTRGNTGEVWSRGGIITKSGDVKHLVRDEKYSDIEWIDGACMLIDSLTFREINGFDEDYFLYWEDVDISNRVQMHGSISCVSSARARQDTETAPIYFRTRNQVLFWRKRRQWRLVTVAVLRAIAKIFIRDIPRRRTRSILARVAALKDGFSGRLSLRHLSAREA
ncbi:glycosyltransferase [Rhodococcus jostii]|uniref:glycosyltransferase n=1 Tax=Rhodococcus jostii TaxID=132919 RepID=UPI00364E8255